jgi:hypothetical protein
MPPEKRPGRDWTEARSAEYSIFTVQSLPGLFLAALIPLSWLIPPGFLLPLEIEMTIKKA